MPAKIAVVTALFGSRSELPPARSESGVDHYAFVDQLRPESNGWTQVAGPQFSLHPHFRSRRDAKIYKVLPEIFLPGYDIYVWHDATHEMVVPPGQASELLENADWAVFRHPDRACVYDEFDAVLEMRLDDPGLLDRQRDHYRAAGFPADAGLYELSCFVRRSNFDSRRVALAWWEQICQYSSRDQLSFPFVLWQSSTKTRLTLLPGFANRPWKNEFFHHRGEVQVTKQLPAPPEPKFLKRLTRLWIGKGC